MRHRVILVALAGAVAACSRSNGGIAPSALSIVGRWSQGANLRDTVNNQTHIHTGHFAFSAQGSGFAGSGDQTGLCHAASGDYEGPLATGATFALAQGVQAGQHISFKSDMCTYDGTISADGGRIDGTERCAYIQNGVSFVFAGDWLATRQ